MSDNDATQERPEPDPGNSPPEAWTEPLADEELAEAYRRLGVPPGDEVPPGSGDA